MEPKKIKWSVLIATAIILSSAAFAQANVESYDPMLQITHQFAHPNLLLVLDVTGSMSSEATSETDVGVDSTGFPKWNYEGGWTSTGWNSDPDGGGPQISPQARFGAYPATTKYCHVYTLKDLNPSRMAMVKNALGNSVTLYDWTQPDWTIPANRPTISGWNYGGVYAGNSWWWTGKTNSTAPGVPVVFTEATVPGTLTVSSQPKDLIGQNKNTVNWGVVVYSASYGNCSQATVQATFNLNENGDVAQLENLFKLKSAGGLDCGGYTSTRGAMAFAKTFLQKSATGGTIDDYDNTNHAVQRDNKFFACNRTYGCILVTDGLSNRCNESDNIGSGNNWINPCGAAPYDCDTGAGTYDCDRRNGKSRVFSKYPPGKINELWNATVVDPDSGKTYRLNARTWVIGCSTAVNPCELNFDAYMGRTDASASKGDAGFNTGADLARLPHMNTITDPETGRVLAYTTLIDNEEGTSHYNDNDPRTTGKNYAYFATNANTLASAFAEIIAGMATGDYTTSAPVGTPATAGGGYYGYLATADFPDWRGHLYCYDTNTDPAVLQYDAGDKLAAMAAANRKIYTWNSSNALVEVTAANLAALKSIALDFTPTLDTSKFTTQVIDFIRGNDGNGVPRSWRLGPIMNSSPTIVGKPLVFEQGTVDASHTDFAATNGSRKPLLYVGSDDGMLHAFLITDETETNAAYEAGTELFAILPPNLLANQITLYQNYASTGIVTGQPKQTDLHIYGVANSPRYGDVYFPGESKWKTVMFLTEGPGGEMVASIDISNPFGNLTLETPVPPVSILWHFTSETCPELKKSWSLPAFGSISSTGFKGVVGTGYDTVNNVTSPYLLAFDPVNGAMTKHSLPGTAGSYMRNQAFCHSVIFQAEKNGYYDDNLVNVGLQADLNGKIWFYNVASNTVTAGINVSPEPIYYSPAVSGYTKGTENYDIYAFATGTQYERDPDITGPNIGSGSYFIPKIYIATQNPWSTTPNVQINSTPLKNLQYTYTDENGDAQVGTLGPRSQVTTSPVLIVPVDGVNDPQAVFACYDPDTDDCAGTSYIISVKITFASNGTANVSTTGVSAGSGAISGFTIVGGKVVVAKSGVGEGQKATLSKVPGFELTAFGGPPRPNWWRELQ